MEEMSLEQFLDYKNYIDIQNCFDLANTKDQEADMKNK